MVRQAHPVRGPKGKGSNGAHSRYIGKRSRRIGVLFSTITTLLKKGWMCCFKCASSLYLLCCMDACTCGYLATRTRFTSNTSTGTGGAGTGESLASESRRSGHGRRVFSANRLGSRWLQAECETFCTVHPGVFLSSLSGNRLDAWFCRRL